MPSADPSLPLIDLGSGDPPVVIDEACRRHGFFLVTSHGIPQELIDRLDRLAREFFALPEEQKSEIAMELGGRAWRGWFPVGGELTSGRPDRKEGIYFGTELPAGDRRPMHGPNLFPREPTELRDTVLEYLDLMTALGHRLIRAVDLALGVDGRLTEMTRDPLVLFRIFGYPAPDDDHPSTPEEWGVGEHTDYGLLAILHQDASGGLQVKSGGRWIDVPPIRGAFVCNIGDMLEKATGGRYRSNPHRVGVTTSGRRISMPFFFDPGWDARVEPLVDGPSAADPDRWDHADPHLFDGPYGDYVWSKVGKVFPDLQG